MSTEHIGIGVTDHRQDCIECHPDLHPILTTTEDVAQDSFDREKCHRMKAIGDAQMIYFLYEVINAMKAEIAR